MGKTLFFHIPDSETYRDVSDYKQELIVPLAYPATASSV